MNYSETLSGREEEKLILMTADEELSLTELEIKNERYFIKGVIDHFEKNQAVIKLENQQELLWPIDKLPDGCREGEAIRLIFSNFENDRQEKEVLAKTILNQILKIG